MKKPTTPYRAPYINTSLSIRREKLAAATKDPSVTVWAYNRSDLPNARGKGTRRKGTLTIPYFSNGEHHGLTLENTWIPINLSDKGRITDILSSQVLISQLVQGTVELVSDEVGEKEMENPEVISERSRLLRLKAAAGSAPEITQERDRKIEMEDRRAAAAAANNPEQLEAYRQISQADRDLIDEQSEDDVGNDLNPTLLEVLTDDTLADEDRYGVIRNVESELTDADWEYLRDNTDSPILTGLVKEHI